MEHHAILLDHSSRVAAYVGIHRDDVEASSIRYVAVCTHREVDGAVVVNVTDECERRSRFPHLVAGVPTRARPRRLVAAAAAHVVMRLDAASPVHEEPPQRASVGGGAAGCDRCICVPPRRAGDHVVDAVSVHVGKGKASEQAGTAVGTHAVDAAVARDAQTRDAVAVAVNRLVVDGAYHARHVAARLVERHEPHLLMQHGNGEDVGLVPALGRGERGRHTIRRRDGRPRDIAPVGGAVVHRLVVGLAAVDLHLVRARGGHEVLLEPLREADDIDVRVEEQDDDAELIQADRQVADAVFIDVANGAGV
mmetsp:Transcript_2508/g.8563  ORF Transcript_2508/g.8563 Transcript_2508/m.8563 type:complete len:308 (-) Transcript_2508:640-1563(-)